MALSKIIFTSGLLFFVSLVGYSQKESSSLMGKCVGCSDKTTAKTMEIEAKHNFDGSFYIITNSSHPESFTDEIYSIVEKNRKANKDVEIEVGTRSKLIIYSLSKIQKKGFKPAEKMIQFK